MRTPEVLAGPTREMFPAASEWPEVNPTWDWLSQVMQSVTIRIIPYSGTLCTKTRKAG